MENRMKLGFSRMIRASFGSCRTQSIPDVIEKAVFVPQNQTQHFRVFEQPPPPSPKPPPFLSINKPQTGPRQKVLDQYYSPLGKWGSTCPPVSPVSPFMYYKRERKNNNNERSGSKHKSNKKKSRMKSKNREARLLSSSSRDNSAYYSWFSSDDDDGDGTDTHTLSSSWSTTLSSDSSRFLRRKRRSTPRTKGRVGSHGSEIGDNNNVLALMEGRVKDSFAVVKKSSDPYKDFRTSMVEMIVEKQIFGAKDLENLLQLFLCLNRDCHHRIIVEVFTEIWEALFSDWS